MSELGRYIGWIAKDFLTNAQTIRDVLAEVAAHDEKFKHKVYDPAKGHAEEAVVILLDGINIRQKQELETVVPDNSEIACFYPFGGG